MKNSIFKRLLTTIILIFVLMIMMIVYIVSSFYKSSVNSIIELGESNLSSQSAMIEDYINKGYDALNVTADTVYFMIEKGVGNDVILEYLTEETERSGENINPDFTGIYAYVNGELLHGGGWIPPEGFDPTGRVWFTAAKEAGGEAVIVSPYVDAQTNAVLISVSRMLPDGETVVSLDITLNKIQDITETMTMLDKGYGFILDSSGLVVAHSDKNEKGKIYPENDEQKALISGIEENSDNYFYITLDDTKSIVFSKKIKNEWYAVIVADNSEILDDLKKQIMVCVFVSAAVFLLIAAFTLLAGKSISDSRKKEQESQEKLDKVNMNIIRSLAYTIDAKDRYTSGHSQRVADYSLAIAKRMGKSEEEQNIIYYAGLLHDVGKIRVPESLINKPGKLTDEEFDQIKVHPVSGFQILRDIHEDERIGYGAKYHHERYDGRGYPNGLAGENIPEIARIIGVADAYDAMASNRSYRNALPQEVVRQEIEKGRGKQFDPDIANIMLEMIDEDKEYKMCQRDSEIKNILVVDDELMNIKMVERILKDLSSVKIIRAMNKDETFAALESNEISLIMLDLRMPDVDGFELYRMIREKYNTPVVIMSADRSIETIKRITELGIDDYLTKPLNQFITQEMVYGIINYRRGNL